MTLSRDVTQSGHIFPAFPGCSVETRSGLREKAGHGGEEIEAVPVEGGGGPHGAGGSEPQRRARACQ